MSTDTTFRRFGVGKACVLGAVGLLVALSGQAAERVMLGTQVSSVNVFYGDLDLTSDAGARTLYARLEFAASQVCGGEPNLLHELQKHHSFDSCFDKALDGAVKKVGDARLQALHRARSSESRVS